MIGALARRFFGSANDRYIKGLASVVRDVNALEPSTKSCPTPSQRFAKRPSVSWGSAISTSS